MHFYFPKFRALCMAENATHNLHNLLTCAGLCYPWLGGISHRGDRHLHRRTDFVFASHHWPTVGKREYRIPFLQRTCTPICMTRPCALNRA